MFGFGKDNEKYSNDKVRNNLHKGYYDNWESQEVARKLRTDSDYRYRVEKNMRRGLSFERAIDEEER